MNKSTQTEPEWVQEARNLKRYRDIAEQSIPDSLSLLMNKRDPSEFIQMRRDVDGWGDAEVAAFQGSYDEVVRNPDLRKEMIDSMYLKKAASEMRDMKSMGMDGAPDILREPFIGVKSAVGDITSTVVRPFSSKLADKINRENNYTEQVATEAAQGDNTPDWLQSGIRGATRSIYQAAALSPLGQYGIIAGFGVTRGNQALTEAKDAGLTGKQKWGYVGRAAMIEGGIAAAFSLLGAGGFEKMLGGSTRMTAAGLKGVLKSTGISLLHELPEENITEIADMFNQKMSGVDKSEITWEKVGQILTDTTIQTALTVGLTGAAQGISAYNPVQDEKRSALISQIAERYGLETDKAKKVIDKAASGKGDFNEAVGRGLIDEAIKTPEGLKAWVETNPESAVFIADIEKPSRQDFEKAGLPHVSKKERIEMADAIRETKPSIDEIKAADPEIKPPEVKEGTEIEESEIAPDDGTEAESESVKEETVQKDNSDNVNKIDSATLIETSNGRWKFAGEVPSGLAYKRIDGKPLSKEDEFGIKQFGAGLFKKTIKGLSWDTKEEALSALRDYKKSTPSDLPSVKSDIGIEKDVKPEAKPEIKPTDSKPEPRTLDNEGRVTDGIGISEGDTFNTSSGRVTTPYPKERKKQVNANRRKTEKWLIENAVAEAESRGDDYNAKMFKNETPGNVPPASLSSMNEYLFGKQPEVVPSILKKISDSETKTGTTPPLTEEQVRAALPASVRKAPANNITSSEIELAAKSLGVTHDEVFNILNPLKNTIAPETAKEHNNIKEESINESSKSNTETGTSTDDESDSKRPSEAGSSSESATTESQPGKRSSDKITDKDVRTAESDADSGVSGNAVSSDPVGVEGQSASDRGGEPSSVDSQHGVVPKAPEHSNDDTGRADTSVDKPGAVENTNYDLRDKAPIELAKGARRKANEDAKNLLERGAPYSEEEKNVLRQYTGEGGLSSGTSESLNQHYTSYETIRAMFKALRDAGVKLNNLLEPAVGAGNFVGHAPEANWTTIDIDENNHKITSALYPTAKNYLSTFEKFQTGGFDAVISNVPFLEIRGPERKNARPDIKMLHDFYFAHALDRVKDDGVIAFITSKGTMDKLDSSIREEIVSKGDIIGAFRLPGGHFAKNAHTDVITDMIFIQKRPDGVPARPEVAAGNDLFVKSTKTTDDIALNEYYQSNPDAVLGQMVLGVNKLYGGRPAYNVTGPAQFDKVSLNYKPYGKPEKKKSKGLKENPTTAPRDSKEFAVWANDNNIAVKYDTASNYAENIELHDGVVYAVKEELTFTDIAQNVKVFSPVEGEIASKISALDNIRKLGNDFQSTLNEDSATAGIKAIQDYKEKYGKAPKKDRKLKAFFKKSNEDVFFAELSSLFDEDFTPAEVFYNTVKHEDSGRIQASSHDDIRTRAVAAEDNTGVIDFSDKNDTISVKDVPELLSAGYALTSFNKNKPVLQNDILYYSGNIYEKISGVENLIEDGNEKFKDILAVQKEKLLSVMPEPKSLENINVKGSETWITPFFNRAGIKIDSFITKEGMKQFTANWHKFTYPETEVYENYLNNHVLVSRKSSDGIKESMGSYMTRLREAENDLRNAKEKVKTALMDDANIKKSIEDAYNARYRNYVKPDYEKASYLIKDVLDEITANSPIKLRKNQISWVVQALYEGKGINAHDVGGGKTMAAITLARALKLRGRAKKPLFTVPAKTIGTWVSTTKLLFPNAKIVNLGSLPANKRQEALFSLSNSNTDYVYISHEGFGQIKLPVEIEKSYARAAMNEHVDDPDARGRQKALLKEKMDDYMYSLSHDNRDTRLTWDKLGVDCIIADEAHAFKNIGINNQLVKYGLGVPFGFNKKGNALKSARSYDFRFKANYVSEKNNGGNMFLLTATPTPNKPMEIYTMLRHFGPNVFNEYGLGNDRDFSSMFLELGTVQDLNKGKPKQILKAIKNAQELRGILNRFVDKMSMDDMPWIKIPKANENRVYVDQSDAYAEVARDLVERQKNLPHPSKEGDDTLVAIYTGGRSASVDPRLYGGDHANVEIEGRSFNSDDDKLQWTIETVSKTARGNANAGQLIFLDDSGHSQKARGRLAENIHTEIKNELISRGMKANEIAIINGKEITNLATGKETSPGTKSAERKTTIQEAYNAGKIKVVIGSTTSMGEGMNLQVKTTDIYHLDIPYTPGAIQQRNGRGVRPGNENETVNIHYLMMRGSFDSMSLGIIMTKKGWNEAIWDKDIADTISTEEEMTMGVVPSQKQILIELEKDPIRKKQMEVRFKLETMDAQLDAWRNEHYALASRVRGKMADVTSLNATHKDRVARLASLQPDMGIKNKTKRMEQYETSKAYAKRMIEVTEKRISQAEESIEYLNENAKKLADEIRKLHGDIEEYRSKYYADDGTSKINEDNLHDIDEGIEDDQTDSNDDVNQFSPQQGSEYTPPPVTAPARKIGSRKLTQPADIITAIKRDWPEISLSGFATFRKKKAAGFYNAMLGTIRLKDSRDIRAALHELGHHYDKVLGSWSNQNKGRTSGMPAELITLGKKLYPGKAPAGGWKAEGFAEFMRMYLQGDSSLSTESPLLYEWFLNHLIENPKDAKKIRNLESLVVGLETQTPEERIRAFHQPLKKDWSPKRTMARASAWIDDNIRDTNLVFQRVMTEAGVKAESADKDPFMLATAFTQAAPGRVKHSVMTATTDLFGTETGESLYQAKEQVSAMGEEMEENFWDYMIARRAIDLHTRGIQSGVPTEAAVALVEKYDSEVFQDAARRVSDWSIRVMEPLVQAGVITQSELVKIVENNPVYVPFSRRFFEGERKKGKDGDGGGRGVYKIKGSGREIHHPLDALIWQAERIYTVAQQGMVRKAVVDLYNKAANTGEHTALGKLLRPVPAPMNSTTFTAEHIKKQMAEKAVELGADPLEVANAMMDVWDETLTVYTKSSQYKGYQHVTPITVDGVTSWYEVTPAFYDALNGMNGVGRLDSPLWEALRQTSKMSVQLARLGATGLNPGFGLVRNLLRDDTTTFVTGDYRNRIPIITNLSGVFEEAFANNADTRLYNAMAVSLSGWYGQDDRSTDKLKKQSSATTFGKKAMVEISHPVELARTLLGATEAGPRFAEFKAAYKDVIDNGGSHDAAAITASIAARDVSVNFARGGKITREANLISLFLNAGVQSVDKLGRSFIYYKGKKDIPKATARTMARAGTWITMMSLLSYYKNRDEDWWKELPSHEKWTHTHWQLGDITVRVPQAFEFGMLFGSLPMAILEENRHPGAIGEWKEEFLSRLLPIDARSPSKALRSVQLIAPLVDVLANEDWKGEEIVKPFVMKSREKQDWYGSGTSKMAIKMCKFMSDYAKIKLSPAQVEHVVHGYTGGLFRRMAGTLDTMIDPSRLKEPSKLPVLGTLFLRDNTSRLTTDFYGKLEGLRQKKGSGNASIEEIGELSLAERLIDDLSDKWKERREVQDALKAGTAKPLTDAIMQSIHDDIRKHNKQDYRKAGMQSIVYAATNPNAKAEDIAHIKELISGEDWSTLSSALRREVIRRKGKTHRLIDSKGKHTAYGRRFYLLRKLQN